MSHALVFEFVSRTSTAHRSAEKEGGGARVFIYLEIKKASTIRETSRMLPYGPGCSVEALRGSSRVKYRCESADPNVNETRLDLGYGCERRRS